jgi:hypothetical protein
MANVDVREALREELDRMTDAELAEIREFIANKRRESTAEAGRKAALARIAARREKGPTFPADRIDAWIRASRP